MKVNCGLVEGVSQQFCLLPQGKRHGGEVIGLGIVVGMLCSIVVVDP